MLKAGIILTLILLSTYPVVAGPMPDEYYVEFREYYLGFNSSKETFLPLVDLNITGRITVLSISLNLSDYNHSLIGDFFEITDEVNLTEPFTSQSIFYEGEFKYIFTTADLIRSILLRPEINSTLSIPSYSINLVYLNPMYKTSSHNTLYTFDNQHVSDYQRLGPGAELIVWLYSPIATEVYFNHSGNYFYFNITANGINRIEFTIDNNTKGLPTGQRDNWRVLITTKLPTNLSYFAISPNDGLQNPNYTTGIIIPLDVLYEFGRTVFIALVSALFILIVIGSFWGFSRKKSLNQISGNGQNKPL